MTVRDALKKVQLKNGENGDCKIDFPFGMVDLCLYKKDNKMYINYPGLDEKTANEILNAPILSYEIKSNSVYTIRICLLTESNKLQLIPV